MNSQKAVRELWHALFALAGLKTGKRRFWSWHEIPSVFFFPACGKWVAVACVRASVRVLKKERRARTSLCVCVCVCAPLFSHFPHISCSSASKAVPRSPSLHGSRDPKNKAFGNASIPPRCAASHVLWTAAWARWQKVESHTDGEMRGSTRLGLSTDGHGQTRQSLVRRK